MYTNVTVDLGPVLGTRQVVVATRNRTIAKRVAVKVWRNLKTIDGWHEITRVRAIASCLCIETPYYWNENGDWVG